MVGFSISYESNERVIALVKRALVKIAERLYGNKYQSVISIVELAKLFKDFRCNLNGEGELLAGDLPRVSLAKISLLLTAPAISTSRLVSIQLVLYYDSSDMLSGRMVWFQKPIDGSRKPIIKYIDNLFVAESLLEFFHDEIVSSPVHYSAIKSQLRSLPESRATIHSHSVPAVPAVSTVPTLPAIPKKSSSYPKM